MIDPNELLVFVVGIERYAGGEGWRVPGAARDALEFAKWLIDRGLPPQNIHAFLSLLKDEDSADWAPLVNRGVTVYPAATDDLYRALDGELRRRKPVRFCLFWGGHGCARDRDKNRILLGADATIENVQGIDLTQFQEFLRTDLVGWGKSEDRRDFVIIVDACAEFLYERGFDRRINGRGFSSSAPTRRSQFSLLSSSLGQRAQNRDLERTGSFSKELRVLLQDVPDLSGLFQLENVARRLVDRFDQLNRDGFHQQTPIYCETRDFSGWERRSGNESIEQIDQRRPSYAVPRRDLGELCASLARIDPPIPADTVRELYRLAAPVRRSAPGSRGDLGCLIECVLDLSRRSAVKPLVEFLRAVRNNIPNEQATVSDSIEDWVHRASAQRPAGISTAHSPTPSPRSEAPSSRVIQIVVVPAFGFEDTGDRYRVRAAVYSTTNGAGKTSMPFEKIRTPSKDVTVADLCDIVDAAFREALDKIGSLENVRMEAVLPVELLPLGASAWKAFWGSRHVPIDTCCPLALRSYERGYRRAYAGPRAKQRDKWKLTRGELEETHIAWSERVSELDEREFDRWDRQDILAVCALSLEGERRQVAAALNRLIGAGISVGLWFWQPSLPGNGWRQAVQERFVTYPPDEWPRQALEFQQTLAETRLPTCKGVVLLWDNPEQPLVPLPGWKSARLRKPKTGTGA